jgi:hypothetical protein
MPPRIQSIRAALLTSGNHSHTSPKFQDDLLMYAEAFSANGNCLIEVGCFRGGMTVQFASLAQRLKQHVHVIDIDQGYLDLTKQLVETMVGASNVTFHLCDLSTFVHGAGRDTRPTLILIDGDHRYDGVVADIRALYAMRTPPFAVAFHDFSLRYATVEGADVRVDRALRNTLGTDFPHIPIGEVSRIGGFLRTDPGADGHYHEIGCPEGVLVEFREMLT